VSLILLFLASFAVAMALTPLIRSAALRLGVVDHPERRKMHHLPVPLLGGASIVLSFAAVVTSVILVKPELLGEEIGMVRPLLLSGVLISIVGAYDDWRGLSVLQKFLFQLIAASILVASGIHARLFTNPLGESLELGWIGVPITVLWVVGVTNAMNLIDGLDGLATGVGVIASLSLCGIAAATDQPVVAILSFVLAGASLGFLPFNMYPARIFLGDTGSMFLGFLLAGLGLAGSLKASTATILILPIVVLGVPLMDTLWAILRRTRSRVSPFKADRDHIHHRLVRVGLQHRHVVLVLYFICAFLGLSADLMVQLPSRIGFLFATMLVTGGITGVWILKYIEDHVQDRILESPHSPESRRATPPPEATPSSLLWQSSNGGKAMPIGEFQVSVCEIGRFHEAVTVSPSFSSVAREVREALSRRIKVHAVGAFLQEDRTLLLVIKTERIGSEGLDLVRAAIVRYFDEQADRWGEARTLGAFRWVRTGELTEHAASPPGIMAR
jgi:UDP-GlcNAc:undecaprenyl-phosphate/decaprenyl-phosphate GlcNAc-1-phosphate transferase